MILRASILFCYSFLFFSSIHIKAQIVRGKVLDLETEEPIPFANIYFNSSQRGTTTDENGQFELSTEGYDGQDIAVSCMGYDTKLIEDFQENKLYRVFLKPSSHLLREVVIVVDDMPRKKKEKIFLREFLGMTRNARKCQIENLEDVVLAYFKTTKTLEAYCYEPLIIRNEALGYNIKYFLDSFKIDLNNMYYQGNFLFEEDAILEVNDREKVLKLREKTYYGSRMHFFRVLWNGDVGNTDYVLESSDSVQTLSIDSVVTKQQDKIKYLMPNNFKYFKIIYRGYFSFILFNDQNGVPFSQSGFFDSRSVYWRGKMAKQRIGDLLPYEYWPYL